MIDPAFWKGKSVLITGHNGFKGSWLSLWLHSLGAKVTGISLAPPPGPNMCHAIRLDSFTDSSTGDVCDALLLDRLFTQAQPEIVFHLAAQSIVRISYLDPVETFRANVQGTVQVLDSVRKSRSTRAVVVVTSDKCYENQEWVWGYRENDRLGGSDPYSASKACAELATAAYAASFFPRDKYDDHHVAVASVRAGNVIGGGDWSPDRIIPDIVRAVIQGSVTQVRNPGAVRPWQHVLEPLGGYIALAEKLVHSGPAFAEPWNFGPANSDAKPVAWITEEFLKHWGKSNAWRAAAQAGQPHETRYLRIDSSKAMQRLDWRPRWNIEKALMETVRWYKAGNDGADMHQLSLSQIREYSENPGAHAPERVSR